MDEQLLRDVIDMCEGWAAHMGGGCGVANQMPVHRRTIAALREWLSDAKASAAWHLTDAKINSLQVESIDSLIRRAKAAHYVNVLVRINGKDEIYEADWLKHLHRTAPSAGSAQTGE